MGRGLLEGLGPTAGFLRSAERSREVVVTTGTNSVSTQTHYLVFGDQDFSRFVDGERSTKTRRAQELVTQGHSVEVISERDFLAMLAH
jgi:hypothetical protein